MSIEAMKLALEALETNNKAWKALADSGDAGWWEAEEQPFYEMSIKSITALRQAIEQAEQAQPVAWYCKEGLNRGVSLKQESLEWEPLYTALPQRKPLHDMAVFDLADTYLYEGGKNYGVLAFARAIEAAHGITKGEV